MQQEARFLVEQVEEKHKRGELDKETVMKVLDCLVNSSEDGLDDVWNYLTILTTAEEEIKVLMDEEHQEVRIICDVCLEKIENISSPEVLIHACRHVVHK